jgi:hypothetical protein
MDELEAFAEQMRRYIEETFAEQPALRQFNLEILEQELARVRREEAELAAKH